MVCTSTVALTVLETGLKIHFIIAVWLLASKCCSYRQKKEELSQEDVIGLRS